MVSTWDTRRVLVVVLFVLVFVLGSCSEDPGTGSGSSAAGESCVDDGLPIDAKLSIEQNATDQDTGVHGLLGATG